MRHEDTNAARLTTIPDPGPGPDNPLVGVYVPQDREAERDRMIVRMKRDHERQAVRRLATESEIGQAGIPIL